MLEMPKPYSRNYYNELAKYYMAKYSKYDSHVLGTMKRYFTKYEPMKHHCQLIVIERLIMLKQIDEMWEDLLL